MDCCPYWDMIAIANWDFVHSLPLCYIRSRSSAIILFTHLMHSIQQGKNIDHHAQFISRFASWYLLDRIFVCAYSKTGHGLYVCDFTIVVCSHLSSWFDHKEPTCNPHIRDGGRFIWCNLWNVRKRHTCNETMHI